MTAVLIADNDDMRRELLCSVLTRCGFVTDATASGDLAVEHLERSRPALIVCSAELAGVGSGELAGRAKVRDSHVRVAVLASARGDATAADPSIDAVLGYPFCVADLTALLEQWHLVTEIGPSKVGGGPNVPPPRAPARLRVMTMRMPSVQLTEPATSLGLPAMPIPVPLTPPGAGPSAEPTVEPTAGPTAVPIADEDTQSLPEIELVEPAPSDAPLPEIELVESVPAPAAIELPAIELTELAYERGDDELPEIALDEDEPVATPSEAALPEIALDEDEPVATPSEAALPEIALDEDEPVAEPPPQEVAPSAPAATTGATVALSRDDIEGVTLPPSRLESVDARDEVVGFPPLNGAIEQVGLPRIVFEIYTHTFSGILHLSRQGLTRDIYFLGGIPTRVDSTQLTENLGRLLVDHGRISMEQYTEAQQVALERKLRQSAALIAIGALTESDLLDALQMQAEQKFVNSFAWHDGQYLLEPTEAFAASSVRNEIHPLQALWRGVAEYYDLGSLEDFFAADRGHYIVATNLFAVHYATFATHLRGLGVLEVLDGQTQVGTVLAGEPEQARQLARALHVLVVTHMVHLADSPGLAAEIPEIEDVATPVAVPSATDNQLIQEIAAQYLRMKDCSYFQALGVGRDATTKDIDDAFAERMAQLQLNTLPATLPASAASHANELANMLTTARIVLRDPRARGHYVDDLPDIKSDEAIRLNETLSTAERLYEEGRILIDRGDWTEARERLQLAAEQNKGEPLYRVALARAIACEEKGGAELACARAIACLTQALQLDPANVDANLEMAEVLLQGGRILEAEPFIDKVRQRAPENQRARDLFNRMDSPAGIEVLDDERGAVQEENGGDPGGEQAEALVKQRLMIRCKRAGAKDIVGYTSDVSPSRIVVSARTVPDKKADIALEVRVPGKGDVIMLGRVSWAKHTHHALGAIQIQSCFVIELDEPPAEWTEFIAALGE